MMALADFRINVGQPTKALLMNGFACGRLAERFRRVGAMRLAEGVTAGGERDGFFRIHRHAAKVAAHVAGRCSGSGLPPGLRG